MAETMTVVRLISDGGVIEVGGLEPENIEWIISFDRSLGNDGWKLEAVSALDYDGAKTMKHLYRREPRQDGQKWERKFVTCLVSDNGVIDIDGEEPEECNWIEYLRPELEAQGWSQVVITPILFDGARAFEFIFQREKQEISDK